MSANTTAATLQSQEYEAVIGLEVHVELATESKMFCGCEVSFGGEPNTRTCPVCLALPGSLPVPNAKSIDYSIKIGLALGCSIAEFSQFHRKNYFYPDMPKDYQISQYDLPLCVGGHLDVEVGEEKTRIGVTRVHLEEDTGKMVHVGTSGRLAGADYSLVDFNRAGTPLVEIVSEPDIRTPEQARAYVQKLRSILLYLGVSDCNMEEGSMRCDANVSLRPVGQDDFGTKAEIKNMNSLRGIQRGIAYEIERQVQVLRDGGRVVQETRHWDADNGRTSPIRSKEEAHDYRYFPEPDLVPMVTAKETIEAIRDSLPELPDAKEERLITQYDLRPYDAGVIVGSKAMADFFEEAIAKYPNGQTLVNWMTGDLLGHLNAAGKEFEESPISSDDLVSLLSLMDAGKISGKMAKEVFEDMFATGKSPSVIVKEKGLEQISDESALEKIVEEVMAANPSVVEDFRGGKDKALGFLVGQIMKATKGSANPGIVNKILKDKLT